MSSMAADDHELGEVGPAAIWSVIRGFSSYWILLGALELGVFAALAEGSRSSAAIASRCGASQRRLAVLLDILVALKFLDKNADGYSLMPVSSRFLVAGSPAYMGKLIANSPGRHENWPTLAATIRTGRPVAPIEDDPAAFYAELAEATFAPQFDAARRLIASGALAGLQTVERILELGAGAAPWSAALLEAFPRAIATVNDLPAVTESSRRVLQERHLMERCRLAPGDFHRLELEAGFYDLAVLAHVCRGEGEAGARSLIARVFRALRPGGALLLVDYFTDSGGASSMQALMMDAIMMANTAEGGCFSHRKSRHGCQRRDSNE